MDEQSIFVQAVAIADAAARRRFVRLACRQDAQLEEQVEQLLRLHDNAGSFLKDPLDTALRMTLPMREATHIETAETLCERGHGWQNHFDPPGEPGTLGRVGKYDILSLVAQGGMGVVYRARQVSLRRIVALKMIRDPGLSTPQAVRRLRNEADAAARLQHPNIVSILEFGAFRGMHYCSMEFVEGRTLAEAVAGKPLPSELASKHTEAIATAIHYAHQHGVLHRDLKPANIMLDSADRVRITDFGLAKQMDVMGTMSETGEILGTAGYMSPEQASGRQKSVGTASDVYSIGAILYELLTGVAPFRGGSPMEILRRVCEQEPIPPRQLNAAVPRDLESICLQCLQKDPGRRFATAGELANDLRRFRYGQPVHARSMGPLRRSARWSLYWSLRNRLVVSLSLAVLLLGSIVIGLLTASSRPVAVQGSADARQAEAIVPDQPLQRVELPERQEGHDPVAQPPHQAKDAGEGRFDGAIPDKPGPDKDLPAKAPVVAVEAPPPPLVPPEFDDPLHDLRDLRAAESPRATVTGSAIAGEPFGVADVLVTFDPAALPTLKPDEPVWITEKTQRVLYPAVTRDVDDQHRVRSVRIRFLFQGPEDLQLTATAVGNYPLLITPAQHRLGAQLRELWWRDYTRPALGLTEQLAGHDMLKNYLQMMLARRLGLARPESPPSVTNLLGDPMGLEHYLHLLLGTASLRVALQKEVLLNVANPQELATLALPRSVMPPPVSIPAFPPSPLEPLSEHIPEECFYVRCQTLADWQWFRGALSAWGGNLNELVVQRGLDQGIQRRLERQIALSEETAAELFAGDAIAEFALIGSDTFYLEGAAFGVVVRARDGVALQAVIERQRRSAALATPQARETTEKIAGHSVSFLSTPDNSVRSFHAVDGSVHCVTTSRRLVERFFEAGLGRRSLAKLRAFQYARRKFPLTRDDPVFVYLSDPFFANILSAPYRIEMTRRARALADLELVQMARWAAIAERRPCDTVADLVASGLLPESIRHRPDGSEAVLKAGVPVDSLRGAAGTFLPIPDTRITRATPSEHAAYKEFAEAYNQL